MFTGMFRLTSRTGATFTLVRAFVVRTSAANIHPVTPSSWCAGTPTARMSTAAASDAPLVLRVLANAMSVSNRAAAIVRDVVDSGDLQIVQKTDAYDLQTRADRTAQDCIVNSLRATFPGLVVIGEEGEEHISPPDQIPKDWIVTELHPDGLALKTPEKLLDATVDQLTVWVDPLDGTKEFTDGFLDHVTILIGVAVGDAAVAGVINQPFYVNELPGGGKSLGRIVAGMVGAGAIGADRYGGPPRDERILTTTRSHVTGLVKECTRACNPTEVLRVGGCGYKVLLLVEGRAHVYVFPSPVCKKWDTCAPEAVLHAVGGRMTDVRGLDYAYDKSASFPNEYGTLATADAQQNQQYLDLIPQHVKDRVKDVYKKRNWLFPWGHASNSNK